MDRAGEDGRVIEGACQPGTDVSATTPANAKPASRSRFKFLSPWDLASIPQPEWLIGNLLAAGSFAILYGPPGVGKSFLALDFALEIARSVPVLFVVAEGRGGLHNRLEAWRAKQRAAPGNIFFLTESVNFGDSKIVNEMIVAIRELSEAPKLIVVDTMARCMSGGDENSAKDVGAFISGIDRLRAEVGCAVLLLHHATKNDARVERGSGALRGAADTMMYLDRHGGGLRLSCEKQKDAAPFPNEYLALEMVKLPSGDTSCVIRRDDNNPSCSRLSHTKNEVSLLEIVASTPDGFSHGELKLKFAAMGTKRRSESTFNRTLRALRTCGCLATTEDGRIVLSKQCQMSERCHNSVTTREQVSSVSHPLGVTHDAHVG